MLNDAFIQLFVLFFALFQLFLVVDNHFFLFSQDLLNNLMLVLSELVNRIIGVESQLLVFLPERLQTPKVLIGQRVSLLLPGVSNFDHFRLLFLMNHPQLVTATRTVLRIAGQLPLQLPDHLGLLTLLSLQLADFPLKFKISF